MENVVDGWKEEIVELITGDYDVGIFPMEIEKAKDELIEENPEFKEVILEAYVIILGENEEIEEYYKIGG